ncbi:hypothetical protein S83_035404 [Arachis hypogaea]|nr:uncharacterized protein DS421_11g332590 [Arachis hypogaea]
MNQKQSSKNPQTKTLASTVLPPSGVVVALRNFLLRLVVVLQVSNPSPYSPVASVLVQGSCSAALRPSSRSSPGRRRSSRSTALPHTLLTALTEGNTGKLRTKNGLGDCRLDTVVLFSSSRFGCPSRPPQVPGKHPRHPPPAALLVTREPPPRPHCRLQVPALRLPSLFLIGGAAGRVGDTFT